MATQQARKTMLYSPTDKNKCKSAVSRLLKEKVISLDAEGVQLGKDGPLTLLQIGTLDGDVYLFDVMINEKKQDKMFFKDTALDKILTSTSIVKVIQSCSGDSAALYHQFGIRLENVFDTQVAHLVIEEHKGKRLPTREKLADICKLYSENAEVYEGKDDVKLEWSKIAGNYWAKRPMTQTMIDYASGDVTSLIPEVYETQKEYITRNQLLDLYEERVLEEIELDIEAAAKEKRKQRNFDIRMDILGDMAKKYRRGTVYESITDEDEIKTLKDTNFSELADHSSVITELKLQSMASYLRSLEEKLETPEEFNPDRGVNFKLTDIERFGSEQLKRDALRIKAKVDDVISSDVQRKYKADEPLENISSPEYQIIRNLKPIGDNAPNYPPTVLALHWKIAATEMQDATDALNDDPDYNMTIPVPKLKFFTNNSNVPGNVKRIAQTLLEKNESAILRRIPRKYTKNSQLSDLTTSEKMVLERLKISSESFKPVIVDLHWKVNAEKLEKDIADFRAGNLIVNDGLRRKLDFFQKNKSVPVEVKQKASAFLQLLPPSQGNRGRGRGRRY